MLNAGTIVGSYKLTRQLGQRGQDGEVWEAVKTLTAEASIKYAIKFLHKDSDEARARFKEEIEHLAKAQFKSRHLIEIYDCGQHLDDGEQKPFYVMKELTNPVRLDDYLRSKGMEPNVVVSMLQQAAEGLRDLHEKLVRNHTDIKGSNLLVSMEHEPKLYITDFGFVRKRGEVIDPSREWKNTSRQPPSWVRPDDTDVWQLGTTLRPLFEGVSATETNAIAWLRCLVNEMAPVKEYAPIISSQEICRRLERRKNLSRSGVWCWCPVATREVASLVATAYEYNEDPLTTQLVIDLLLRERKDHLPRRNEEIVQAIECDLSPTDHLTPGSQGTSSLLGTRDAGLSTRLTEEIAKRILFGLPCDESQLAKGAEEWKYLKALIKEIPIRPPTDQEESAYRKHARAVIRQKHVQLSPWDAGVRFLTSGQGTRVYFCSGYDEFAVAKGPLGDTDLRSTAVESLKRGARFVFIVPTANTAGATTAEDFVRYVKGVASALVAQVEIKRVAGRRNTASGADAKKQVPEWMERGRYFTPGFRYVLFKEEDAARSVHDEGAFMVGLPHGTSELFALQYSMDDRMTKDFLRWLTLVGALKST
jgi:serine/threonine protein kinase